MYTSELKTVSSLIKAPFQSKERGIQTVNDDKASVLVGGGVDVSCGGELLVLLLLLVDGAIVARFCCFCCCASLHILAVFRVFFFSCALTSFFFSFFRTVHHCICSDPRRSGELPVHQRCHRRHHTGRWKGQSGDDRELFSNQTFQKSNKYSASCISFGCVHIITCHCCYCAVAAAIFHVEICTRVD